MIKTDGKYYLGRIFDIAKSKLSDQPVLYNPDDLTTHAVVVGMTGSGKTGLCIDLLEEAALNGIPALMIDPKGDITNALLHFPALAAQDFKPWVNPDEARREGKSLDQAASEAAAQWKKGLAEWDIEPERIRSLQKAVQFAIYTPGSDAGIPVSILASLKAPDISWEGNRELLREKISATVTALLGLVGLQDVDPVRSREHILLSNIFETAWSQGGDIDLGELIMQTQNPPFSKLGVFEVNAFFPEKERFELAMLLNNILAAPAFQTWIEGQPLDIPSLLYTPERKPRHSVFYIAHLNDAERMFFVTLLYSAVESWMRAQPGTTSLRAIVYFDEIFGYLPPVAMPPSKPPMLRMLKQARAFGVGQVLVTQNPVDLDYKGLSNAGTWFIGKLQTERDKERLLDGLESAMAGGLNRKEYDRLISSLGKRVFLLHNVHEKKPVIFQTRWAMNYLTGPLTRTQIPALNKLAGAELDSTFAETGTAREVPIPAKVEVAQAPARPAAEKSARRPTLPASIKEYFLPNNLTLSQAFKDAGRPYPEQADSQGLVYRPVLLGQASVRFFDRKYNLDTTLYKTALVANPDPRGVVRWENFTIDLMDVSTLADAPDPQAGFVTPEAPLNDAKAIANLQKDFLDWAFRSGRVSVHANPALKVYAGSQVSPAEFRSLCAEAARNGRDAELKKASASFDTKLKTMKDRLAREGRELTQDEEELSQRKMEEIGTHAENVLGLFLGRRSSRRLSTSLTKRRLTAQSKADVEESLDVLESLKRDIASLEGEKAAALDEVNQRWGEIAAQVEEITVPAQRKDVLLDLFGVVWMPYYLIKVGRETIELPGYGGK